MVGHLLWIKIFKMKTLGIILAVILAVVAYIYVTESDGMGGDYIPLQSQVTPGKLSAAHGHLSTNCAACHTATKGVDDAKCILCHADNKALLQRQPTAFHGMIGNCASCHIEHQGTDANLKTMDHEALAKIGAKIIGKNFLNNPDDRHLPDSHPNVSANVSMLNCATCHSTKDKHQGLMGPNCASCHAATQWTIAEFQHPSVNSINCFQCHKAPPSHSMMHFEMVSKTKAGQREATVTQCFACHQTTSWNDIKGLGYYKHH